MKKYIIVYLLLFINIALGDVKIGYVDSQQIMTQYEGFRMAQVDLEKEQKRLEAEYLVLQQQVDSLYQSFQKQEFMKFVFFYKASTEFGESIDERPCWEKRRRSWKTL